MGDIADYYVEQMIFGHRRGRRSRTTRPNTARCDKCGVTCKWRETPKGWRLFDLDRRGDHNEMLIHDCAVSADDFDDLTQ